MGDKKNCILSLGEGWGTTTIFPEGSCTPCEHHASFTAGHSQQVVAVERSMAQHVRIWLTGSSVASNITSTPNNTGGHVGDVSNVYFVFI